MFCILLKVTKKSSKQMYSYSFLAICLGWIMSLYWLLAGPPHRLSKPS